MKPDHQQKQMLQAYLQKGLSYRETYEEVYDHILASLESKPTGISFADTVNAIIREDFGGSKDLWVMEKNCRKEVEKEVLRKYLRYCLSFFRLSSVIYVVPALLIYYISSYIGFSSFSLASILFAIASLPMLFIYVRYFKIGFVLGDTRPSLRDDVFRKVSYLPFRLFICCLFLFTIGNNAGIVLRRNGADPFILTTGLLLVLIHSLSVSKLNKDEFKMSLIQ